MTAATTRPRPTPARSGGRNAARPRSPGVVKIAVVVQRYGADINGGAELHARYLAEHLSRHVQVEVLTTCARDYITWADAYPPGAATEGAIAVRRFPRYAAARSRRRSARGRSACSDSRHSVNDELAWLDAEGPTSPDAGAIHRRRTRPSTTTSCSSVSATTTRSTAPAPCPARRSSCRRRSATRRSGLGIFPAVLRGVRGVHVQLARGTRAAAGGGRHRRRAWRRRRHRVGRAAVVQSGALPAAHRHPRAAPPSTSAASTRTRAAPSCSTSGSATARSRRAA